MDLDKVDEVVRKTLDYFGQNPPVRWGAVVLAMVLLLRLKLVLFAVALPIWTYWFYTKQWTMEAEAQGDSKPTQPNRGKEEEDDADRWPSRFDDDGDEPFNAEPPGKDTFDFGDLAADIDSKPARTMPPPKSLFESGDDDGEMDFALGGKSANSDLKPPGNFLDDDLDLDFLSSLGVGGAGGGKNRSNDKGNKSKGKGKDKGTGGVRDADPKQIFVAGVAEANEVEIREFFEEAAGEVVEVKILKHPTGESKGVCFVTFRDESQAQTAISQHGKDLKGQRLTVRLAGKGGDDKGGGKGGRFDNSKNRGPPPDLGGAERFGAAFSSLSTPTGNLRPGGGKGKGKGRGTEQKKNDMDDILEKALAKGDCGPIKVGDFDYAARRFLSELRARDKVDGTDRTQEALDHVIKYTASKDRDAIRKWPAYIYKLLEKFDPTLYEELRERIYESAKRDAERRKQVTDKNSPGKSSEESPSPSQSASPVMPASVPDDVPAPSTPPLAAHSPPWKPRDRPAPPRMTETESPELRPSKPPPSLTASPTKLRPDGGSSPSKRLGPPSGS